MAVRPRDRVLQSVWTAAFAVTATVLAHVVGGGAAPSTFVVLAAAVPTVLGVVALSWVPRSSVRVLFAALTSQALFHWLFVAAESRPVGGLTETRLTAIANSHAHHLGSGDGIAGAADTVQMNAGVVTASLVNAGAVTGGGHAHLAGHVAMTVSHMIAAVLIAVIMLAASHLTAALGRVVDLVRERLQLLPRPVALRAENSSKIHRGTLPRRLRTDHDVRRGRAPPAFA